nr:response regulator transcription factor [Bacteroides intestinalis]
MEQIVFKNLVVDQNNKLCSINGEAIALSKKEYELLVFLMSHPNYVHSRESLLEELWDNSVSLRTVDTTVSRLRKKLQEYGAYITTRLGFGYSFNNSD